MNPQDLINQLISSINNPNQSNFQQAAPTGQAGLNPFFQTPMYQLLYGDQANQVDPTQRFRADPGYQFAQSEAARQMQMNGAAHGLLESGPMQVELQRQAQGMADQNYQRWLGQQGSLYGSYQNQLAQLAGAGMGQTGADQANANGGLLAQLLGGYNMTTGSGIGGYNMGTGENISSLLGNQGVLGANAYLNTAAALANTNMNTFGMGAQIANNNALGAAGTWNSGQQGLGSLLGAQAAGGGSSGYGTTTNYGNGQSTYTGNPWGYF